MVSASDLTLILPTLNEQENVVPVVNSILSRYPDIGEIIIVDDNSSDGTREAVSGLLGPRIRLLHRTRDFGLTPSLREAIQLASKPFVAWMDCDGSMPIDTLGELLQTTSKGYNLVVASRFTKGGKQKSTRNPGKDSCLEIWLSDGLNRALHFFFRLPVSDLTSGFLVLEASLAKTLDLRGRHGEYFIFLLLDAKKRGARMTEIPYSCGTRKAGYSKTFGSPKAIVMNSFRYSRAFLSAVVYKCATQ